MPPHHDWLIVCCIVLQCVAVRLPWLTHCVLQCVAVSCSVLQCVCVAVCSSLTIVWLHTMTDSLCVAVSCCVLQCVAVCCSASVLRCVAVSLLYDFTPWLTHCVLQCVAVCCSASVLQCFCVAVCSSLTIVWLYTMTDLFTSRSQEQPPTNKHCPRNESDNTQTLQKTTSH